MAGTRTARSAEACGDLIVSTTAFLRRNNGHALMPETRPYRFNYKVAATTPEKALNGTAESSGLQEALRNVFTLGHAGDARAAVRLAEETALRLRESGRNSAGVLCRLERARSYWLGVSGNYEKAIAALEKLLREPSHSHAPELERLNVRNDIAYWHGEAGAVTHAKKLFEQVMDDAAALLSRDDVYTLSARNSVAYWRGRGGDVRKALAEYDLLVNECEESLGADSRDTLMVRNNIAYWRGESGDTRGALELFEQLLDDTEAALGRGDFYTLSARNNVAYWRGFNGKVGGAIAEYERLLEDCEATLGETDHHTLSTRLQIGLWNGVQGNLDRTIELLCELLADLEEETNISSDLSYSVRHQLGRWYGARGDHGKAVAVLERLVSDQQQTLGENDYRTLASRGLLSRFAHGGRG